MASWPSRPDPFPRLYAILDVDAAAARGLAPLSLLEAWLGAGVRLVQLRAKGLGTGAFLELADAALVATQAAGALLIINDRVDVAALSGADGVHVGQDDLGPHQVRRLLGDAAIVGVSTHTDAQLHAALAGPATYIAIGPVFSTMTKARPDPVVGLDGVRAARERLAGTARPLVAIGGITVETAGSVIDAGADSVAVIADLLTADPGVRARQMLQTLDAR
jgi:thiamine-phosphate pyrophosphorylase